MKAILYIYRIILIVAVILLFGWLIYKNLIVTGQITMAKDFCQESPFISNLYPENRAGGVEIENGSCFQRFFIEPIYFKVKVTRTFAKAKVKIIYQNPGQEIVQLGLMQRRINPLDWRFHLEFLGDKKTLDWQEGVAEFSVRLDYMNDHALEFMLSSPNLTENRNEIKISRIEVELSRPPVNWTNLFPEIKNYLIRKINK